MRSDRLEVALDAYFGHEGAYSNDPADPGGETYYGIARQRNGAWPGWLVIDRLRNAPDFPACLERHDELADLVFDFYRGQWQALGGDDLPPEVAVEMFEAGQNVGPGRAARWLQEVLNACNRNERDWPDLVVDGDVGPKTKGALQVAIRIRGERHVVHALNGRQFVHYWTLVTGPNSERWERFFNGFIGRTVSR